MNNLIKVLSLGVSWFFDEYIKDYRESSNRVYELTIKANTQINQIILTVSVASLTAIAALNDKVFAPYGLLSFLTVASFVLVILLSVVNFHLSYLFLADLQRRLTSNLKSFKPLTNGNEFRKFGIVQSGLNVIILSGFCLGLIALLTLLGYYILGANQ